MDPEIQNELEEQLKKLTETIVMVNNSMLIQQRNFQGLNTTTNAANQSVRQSTDIYSNHNRVIKDNMMAVNKLRQIEEEAAKSRLNSEQNLRIASDKSASALGSFTKAILNTDSGMTKYGDSLKDLGVAGLNLGKNFGVVGTAAGGAAFALGVLAQASLKQADEINNFADTWKKMGAVGVNTNSEITRLGIAAGYATQDLEKLKKPIDVLSNATVSLGITAGHGQKAFLTMIALESSVRKEFNRLGMSMDEVAESQAEYLRFQRLSGVAMKDGIRDQKLLKDASLKYVENLVKLSALTGDNVDEIKRKQRIAYEEYQGQLQDVAERERLRKLQADPTKREEAARLARTIEARAQLKQTSALLPEDIAAGVRDYVRSKGRVSELNQGAYRLGGDELARLSMMINSGRYSQEEINKQEERLLLRLQSEGIRQTGVFAGTSAVMTPEAALEFGSKMGISQQMLGSSFLTRSPEEYAQALREAQANVDKAKEEGYDPAADTRANLTEMGIAAKTFVSSILLGINPFIGGVTGATVATTALAIAAVAAAGALGKVALTGLLGGGFGGGLGRGAGALRTGRGLMGALGTGGRFLGRIGGPLALAGLAGYEGYTRWNEADKELRSGSITEQEARARKGGALGGAIGGFGGGMGGMWAGAAAGGSIGALFGGVGAVPGALIGGLIGGLGGWAAGDKIGKSLGESMSGLREQATQSSDALRMQREGQRATQAQMERTSDQLIDTNSTQIDEISTTTDSLKLINNQFSILAVVSTNYNTQLAFTVDRTEKTNAKLLQLITTLDKINNELPASNRNTGAASAVATSPNPTTPTPLNTGVRAMTGTNVTNEYLARLAMVESGGRTGVRSRTSSATGLFQFTDGTWNEAVTQMGLNPKEYDLDARKDPKKALLVARYVANRDKLKLEKQLGRKVTDVELYLTHFLGYAGAVRFLKGYDANPNMAATSFVGADQARANKEIFYDSGRARSVSEVMTLFEGRFAAKSKRVQTGKDLPQSIRDILGSSDNTLSSVSPAEFLNFGDRSGSLERFRALDSNLQSAVLRAAMEYRATTGKKLKINSGLRTRDEQQVLYDAYLKRGRTGLPAARPGTSRHERGIAVDIQEGRDSAVRDLLAKYGLYRAAGDSDPIHYELKAEKGGLFTGPKTGYPITLHGTEIVAPLKENSILMDMAKTASSSNIISKLEAPNNLQAETLTAINNVASALSTNHTPNNMNMQVVETMFKKIDRLSSLLESNNDLQTKILRQQS